MWHWNTIAARLHKADVYLPILAWPLCSVGYLKDREGIRMRKRIIDRRADGGFPDVNRYYR
jgi:hypothetical protein